MNTEKEDLMLLERVFLRIGSTQTDDQLQTLIDKLLGPIILKVPSPFQSVRDKAVELLTHISKRLKCNTTMQVPVNPLLEMYLQTTQDQFVKNFLVVYIRLGYPRMTIEKQLENLPLLLKCINEPKTTEQLKNSFFILIVRSCKHFAISEATTQFILSHNISEWTNINLILEVFLDALLLPYTYEDSDQFPSGLSNLSFKRLTQDGRINDLFQVKLGIIQLLMNSNLPKKDIYVHITVASIDSSVDLTTPAKQYLKEIYNSFEWTNENLKPLYKLFIGDNERVIIDRRKRPADLKMKINLLPYLQRIHEYCWPECIQVVIKCLVENTNLRLKILGLNFGLTALKKAEPNSFKEIAPNFLNVLTDILWEDETNESVRTLIYRLTGNVISLNPELIKFHKDIFPKFIEDLTEETTPDIRNTIKESLMKMTDAFKQSEESDTLLHFLVNRITSPEPCVKHIVLHYLQKVFPPHHVLSRFLLTWSSADNDSTISAEAENLLYEFLNLSKPVTNIDTVTKRMPDFVEFLNYVYEGCAAKEGGLESKFIFGDQNLTMTKKTYVKIIIFVRSCMLYDCYSPLCSMKFEHPCTYSTRIGQYIRNLQSVDKRSVDRYLDLITRIMCFVDDIQPLDCLLECVGTVPDIFAARYYDKYPIFRRYLYNFNDNICIVTATLYGVILTYGSNDTVLIKNKLQDFKLDLISKVDLTSVHTALWCIASIAERKGFQKICGIPSYIVESIADLLTHNSAVIVTAACHCIGQIGRRNDLPIPNRNLNDDVKYGDFDGLTLKTELGNDNKMGQMSSKTVGNSRMSSPEEHTSSWTKLKVVEKLLDFTVETNTFHKIKMKAAEALGLLCIGEEDFPYRKLIINTIIEKTSDVKEVGILLDFGSVLSDCIMGPHSFRILDLWTQKEVEYKITKNWDHSKAKELFLFTVKKITKEIINEEKCKSKVAAAVWLLMLLKKCLKLPLKSEDLSYIQYTFLDLIYQNDEIVHDAITRGLSYIPRYANEESASDLGKQVAEKIFGINKAASEVGFILGMYKEICYLTASVKNYSVIYHFLNLINYRNRNTPIEKYRSLFKDHEDSSIAKLSPYNIHIVAPLFVYLRHPSPKIKQAMNTIWNSLFSGNTKTIKEHSKIIIEKIVPDITNPNHELRIAYCVALEDLLQIEGNKFVSDHKTLMPELFEKLYKLMDDIYDSVRKPAYAATKMYLHAVVQNVRSETSVGKENELLNLVLPILLNVGVSSKVADIRSVSVKCLLDIVDHLGPLIKHHLHYLIPMMIESVSELDTSEITELSLHFAEQQSVTDKIEIIREVGVSSHFTTKTLGSCIRYMDKEVLQELFPKLLELLKDNISYSTRMASINFVVLLYRNMEKETLQPFVGKLLGVLFTGLTNNHKTIQKNSAQTIGYLCKIAKDSSIDNLLSKLTYLYMKNTEDENIKNAIAQTLLSMASQCQEIIQVKSEKIISVMFFAMHVKKTPDGSNDMHIKLWNEVWNEIIGSIENAISKHKITILLFLQESFNSPTWNTKAQASRALSTFANKCPDNLQECRELKLLVEDMINIINGKIWVGKEEVLDAAATLCFNKRCLNEQLYIKILDAVCKECDRGNVAYQTAALEAIGKILMDANKDYFDNIYPKLKSIIDHNKEVVVDADPEESSIMMNQRIKLKETAYSVLGKVWPENTETQNKYQEEVIYLLTESLFKSVRLTQVSIMVALKNVVSKLNIVKKRRVSTEEEIIFEKIFLNIEKSIRYALELQKHTLLKKEALHVLMNLAENFHDNSARKYTNYITDIFNNYVGNLSKDADPIIALQISQLKDWIKKVNM